jgi:hypothetical protein
MSDVDFVVNQDPVMDEIADAIAFLHGGDRPKARSRFKAIWSRIAGNPEAFHECVLSHYMADAQEDMQHELAWDLRALDAALRCTDAEAQRYQGSLSIAAFMPSLHLNLADDYRKLGDLPRSKQHLALAQKTTESLADDPYGQMIRRGIDSLATKLHAI